MLHSRSVSVSLIVAVFAVLVTGCDTPTPTPTPTRTPLPTLPPPTPVVVTLGASSATIEPSWTPVPTRTNPPTRTPMPTSTPTQRPAATNTPPALAVTAGVLEGNLITVKIHADELERELAVDRNSPLISNSVSANPTVTLSGNVVRLETTFNNYTTEGIRAEVEFSLRFSGDQVRANIADYQSARGTVLTPTQMTAIRDLVNKTINRLFAAHLQIFVPDVEGWQITRTLIQENGVYITAKVTRAPTATPTETTTP